ncbi:cytochrome p450 monooxygenase [Fusarium flagelliforme]|uniref:cytochrome p450 monooxygenase n=1 Tax=Fusarium flagelliforme TaxID=2675880 RepID=UPI001E8EC003|nr:cytochrome p450 monooxygenase [Fusarium flagelliforme]KAH7183661.1 cytochrome p450 monooxygenase [Fusarium flagelliforme]
MGLDYEQARKWTKDIPNCGLIRYYMAGNIERVMVVGSQALSEMMGPKVYDFPKSESLRVKLERFTGNGVLLSEGDEHKMQRRGLLPALAYRHIKDMYPIFLSKSTEMADAIEKQKEAGSNEVTIQVSDWAGRATLDIIGLAVMGRDFNSVQDPKTEFHRVYHKLNMRPSLWNRILILLSILTFGFKMFFQLPTHGVFSEENMVDQIITFLVAGHETTAASLQWAVYALCIYPEIQTRLRDEVRDKLSSGAVTAEDIDGLPYLNAFCNEVLRFYPPVPSTVREARVDTSLAGTFIPKGTTLLILAGATNLEESHWGPGAGRFSPERWLGQGRANSGGADSNYANLTFLQGSRGCIGKGFARSELLCLVAVLASRFKMELQDSNKKLEVVRSISAAPSDGVMARLTPLEG